MLIVKMPSIGMFVCLFVCLFVLLTAVMSSVNQVAE